MQRRPLVQNRRVKRFSCLSIKGFRSEISFGGSLEKVGRLVFVHLYVCLSVCPSIFASGAQTPGPIGTGEYSFDAPERREDDSTIPKCSTIMPK